MQHIVLHNAVMATRLREGASRRPSLPLSSADEDALRLLRESPEMLESLAEFAALEVDLRSATESALLQAIFRAGLRSISEAALARGYDELARQYETELEERYAFARRRRPSWADEA